MIIVYDYRSLTCGNAPDIACDSECICIYLLKNKNAKTLYACYCYNLRDVKTKCLTVSYSK